MFNYTCLNPIAGVGLDLFSDDYKKVDDIKDADAALVRSALCMTWSLVTRCLLWQEQEQE